MIGAPLSWLAPSYTNSLHTRPVPCFTEDFKGTNQLNLTKAES